VNESENTHSVGANKLQSLKLGFERANNDRIGYRDEHEMLTLKYLSGLLRSSVYCYNSIFLVLQLHRLLARLFLLLVQQSAV
jgi:hypothetical protein